MNVSKKVLTTEHAMFFPYFYSIMRWITFFIIIIFSNSVSAKEWRNLKTYQKTTEKQNLSPSDWLKSDRLKNTLVWQRANHYNLTHNLPKEYVNIKERKAFYMWLYNELDKKGHEVVWVKMAHFISTKLHKMESFPFDIFTSKRILGYANRGSKLVFNDAFVPLNSIYQSHKIYTGPNAVQWDKDMLYQEQYFWIAPIYKTMDERSLKKFQRIAKGTFLYAWVVPKAIRFKGNLSNAEARYKYAFNTLRTYCKNRYK
ncbi:Insecticidal toxin complex protein [Hwangdonia sp.]|uniref:Insecticidal toxin complex protein n=1 Tax=Hwangdonia sp. TaxID=1883432 RepID=UPI003AB8FC44